MAEKDITVDELATFCKRKGFVFPSGELYGGLAGFWDFGPLGVELKNSIKRLWWKTFVHSRADVVGMDGAIVTHPKVWEASGHVAHFVDVAVVCKKCKQKSKIDKHEVGKAVCSNCGGELLVKGEFNPMFSTSVGAIKEEALGAYLRPETAQLIFANFKSLTDVSRVRLPFGVAQQGKAFRNELSPREFIFRCREFEQMELEYFISKGMVCPYMDELGDTELQLYSSEMQESGKEMKRMKLFDAWKSGVIKTDWHAYWLGQMYFWFISLGASPEKFRARQHLGTEKSHYAIDTWDLEYQFPMGWRELAGFANRGDFDLKQHEKVSGKSLTMLDPVLGKVVPDVVCEPSLGVERAFMVFLLDAYRYDSERESVVLELDPQLAPFKAGVFPLISKGECLEIAKELFRDLMDEFPVQFDVSGSIGRRDARADEQGTPWCVTVDEDSVRDRAVTVRDRDTTKQIRVPISALRETIRDLLYDKVGFEDAGTPIETRKK